MGSHAPNLSSFPLPRFWDACAAGDLGTARALAEVHGHSWRHQPAVGVRALREASRGGHLGVVRWLVEDQRWRAEAVCASRAAQHALRAGHTLVAEWLARQYPELYDEAFHKKIAAAQGSASPRPLPIRFIMRA